MTTNIKNLNAIRSMTKKQIILSLASIVVIALLPTNQVYAIFEDEVQICIADLKTDVKGDLKCQVFPADDIGISDQKLAELYKEIE